LAGPVKEKKERKKKTREKRKSIKLIGLTASEGKRMKEKSPHTDVGRAVNNHLTRYCGFDTFFCRLTPELQYTVYSHASYHIR
jgi:hypothetical protein